MEIWSLGILGGGIWHPLRHWLAASAAAFASVCRNPRDRVVLLIGLRGCGGGVFGVRHGRRTRHVRDGVRGRYLSVPAKWNYERPTGPQELASGQGVQSFLFRISQAAGMSRCLGGGEDSSLHRTLSSRTSYDDTTPCVSTRYYYQHYPKYYPSTQFLKYKLKIFFFIIGPQEVIGCDQFVLITLIEAALSRFPLIQKKINLNRKREDEKYRFFYAGFANKSTVN